MPVSSEIELCNKALMEIGVDPLSSMEDNSKAGRAIRNLYPSVRDRILCADGIQWEFAIARSVPTPTLEANMTEFENQYSVSFDPPMLKLLAILEHDTKHEIKGIPFKIENNILYCNLSNPILVYVFQQTNVKTFSEPFIDCVRFALAYDLSYYMTGTKPQDLLVKADMALSRAAKQTARHSKTRGSASKSWVNARYA